MVGPRKARWKSEGDSRIAAEAIARHLVLANFVIGRGPPAPAHSTSHYCRGRTPDDGEAEPGE